MAGVACDKVCAVAKEIMPTIFRPNLLRKTSGKWKKKVEKLEELETAEREKEAAAPPQVPLTAAQKDKKRRRNHDAIAVADKQEDFQQQIGTGSNRRILPASLLVGLASLLWVISQSGVPMNSSVALPLMVGHIKEAGYGHLLHSQQSMIPLETMKSIGLAAERGRLFISKSFVNSFCSRIHLKMRRGTGNFAKEKRPTEIDTAKLMMYYRLLYLSVTHKIKANRVFNFDETGIRLLWFGDIGRAQAGQKSVKWHGFDDKRQFTLSVVMDALGKIILPTQCIWAGETGQDGIRNRIPAEHRHEEHLKHEQSNSHWTVLETLKRLILMLASHVKAVCEAEGLVYATTYWILVMDCYSVHIKEEFLEWYQSEFDGHLICLFIPANYTAWLQPLDVSLNYVLKRILKNYAGTWLAALMQQQLKENNNDPTKVKLDIRLTNIRKYVTLWLKQTLIQLNSDKEIPNNLRGWKESGMLDALAADRTIEHPDFLLAKELNEQGELFMDFTGKKNADKAERILKKHMEQHGVVSGSASRFQDVLEQIDAEIEPHDADLLSDDVGGPQIRVEEDRNFTMEELQQLEELHEGDCESAFESVEHMFPALEANGRHVQANLDWDFTDQTSE